MSKSRWLGATLALSALALAAAWWAGAFGPRLSSDPQVAEVQRLRAEVEASPDDDSDRLGELGEKVDELSTGQMLEAFGDMHQSLMAEEEERLTRFFALPPEEQQRELDEVIDRLERARAAAQRFRAERGLPSNPQRSKPERAGSNKKVFLDHTTAEYRALSSEYHNRLTRRMQQRGLTR